MLAKAEGHRRALAHVVAVLLEDDLPAEEVRVLLQCLPHGLHHGVHLRLQGGLRVGEGGGQPARPVEGGGHILIAHLVADVVAGEAVLHLVHIVGRPVQGDLIAVAVPHELVQLLQVLHRLVQAA